MLNLLIVNVILRSVFGGVVSVPVYICNHCGMAVKNNGGSCREVGMIETDTSQVEVVGSDALSVTIRKYYHYECAKEIATNLLEEI